MRRLRLLITGGALVGFIAASVSMCAYVSLESLPVRLAPLGVAAGKAQVLDRNGRPLSYTFASGWNLSDQRLLHDIPAFLQRAFIEAEDRRFFEHAGVDWRARASAVWQNLRARRVVRGASTITEQVVRILHPRPRTLWSRCIEGLEATQLEQRFSKQEILEFYLNQVPFAARRRGVAQAARYYWDRDIQTLTPREQLTLAVLVRAPERLDPYKRPHAVDAAVSALALRMNHVGELSHEDYANAVSSEAPVERAALPVRADHFVQYLHQQLPEAKHTGILQSTLDSHIQATAQRILESRLEDLAPQHVTDGAVLVVDNATGEIRAWVNAGAFNERDESQIDAVLAPRQPGSTLKPFLYALALSRGWTTATIIRDEPLAEAVGAGLHSYKNYSRIYYGDITVREALGNSLNIPAVKTIHFVGSSDFLHFLRQAGFASLTRPADFYGEGLALGNGEVSLFELVQGYAALANRGSFRGLRALRPSEGTPSGSDRGQQLISPDVASLIGNVLSDPHARRREFGSGGVLQFPIQTAVKTGTSTDYRDAWTIAYSARFTVGVWMGNLNRTSMQEITGAKGPALVARSIFSKLERTHESLPLPVSASLIQRTICPLSGLLAEESCPHIDELFIKGTEPTAPCRGDHDSGGRTESETGAAILLPTPGLHLARDPRIPDSLEAFPFEVAAPSDTEEIHWIVDGEKVGTTRGDTRRLIWPLVAGAHEVRAQVVRKGSDASIETATVQFFVK